MTDITKFKSIAIKIDAYKLAKPMADEKYMSMGSFVRYLIDKEYDTHPDKPSLTNGDDTKTTNKKKLLAILETINNLYVILLIVNIYY